MGEFLEIQLKRAEDAFEKAGAAAIDALMKDSMDGSLIDRVMEASDRVSAIKQKISRYENSMAV